MLHTPNRRVAIAAMAGSLVSVPALGSEPMRAVEREVIAAYLNSLEPDKPSAKKLVIEQTTAITDEAFGTIGLANGRDQLAKDLPQASRRGLDDFLRVLAKPSPLWIPSQLVRPNLRLQMVRASDVDRLFDADKLGAAWERFYKAYPDAIGLVRISRVGIDEQTSQALFYMSLRQGGLRGSGHFMLLHRPLGIWRVLATAQAWVS